MKKELTARTVFIVTGAGLAVNAVLHAIVSNMHIGIFAALCLGAIFALYGVFFKEIRSRVSKLLIFTFYICIAVGVFFCSFLLFYGGYDTVGYDEDAVIVLGCGIRGDQLSKTLKDRLDRAIEYHEKNPEAVIVVSGGQGPQEDIPEALAMERYLISRGIPEEKKL